MRRFTAAKLLTLAVVSAGLAACGGTTSILTSPVSPATAYLLTSQNRIIGVDLDDLEYARSVVSVAKATATPNPTSAFALDMGEVILDIDYRNSEGALYALTRGGSDVTATTGRIVRIDPTSGSVSRASTLVKDGTSTTLVNLSATSYTIDFDPSLDRLRVIGSDGSNLQVDAQTGDTITLSNVSSGNTLSGTAYRDDFAKDPGTGRAAPLLSIDIAAAKVFQTSPDGTLDAGKTLGIGSISAIGGYDINPSNNASIAILTVGGITSAYTLDPTKDASARSLGRLPGLPDPESYRGLSIITQANPTVTALDKTNHLYTFRARTPSEVSVATPANFTPNTDEKLIGIDFRQSDRVLYGLSNQGKIYNLSSSSATQPLKSLTLKANVGYTLDFDSAILMGESGNRMRLIGTDNSNIAINIDVSAADTAGRPVSGTPTPTVVAAAYLNNYRGSTVSELYVIDRSSSSLNFQTTTAGDTEGVLTRISLLGITLDPNSPVGFDISGRGNENQFLMARTTPGGPFTLYRINVRSTTSSPLTAVGSIAGSDNFIDIAIQF